MTETHQRDAMFSNLLIGQPGPEIEPVAGLSGPLLDNAMDLPEASWAESILQQYHGYLQRTSDGGPFGAIEYDDLANIIRRHIQPGSLTVRIPTAIGNQASATLAVFGDSSALLWKNGDGGMCHLIPQPFILRLPEKIYLRRQFATSLDGQMIDLKYSLHKSYRENNVTFLGTPDAGVSFTQALEHEARAWMEWSTTAHQVIKSHHTIELEKPLVIHPWFESFYAFSATHQDLLESYSCDLLCFILAKEGLGAGAFASSAILGRTLNRDYTLSEVGFNFTPHASNPELERIAKRWGSFIQGAFNHPACPVPPKAQIRYDWGNEATQLVEMFGSDTANLTAHEYLESISRVEALALKLPNLEPMQCR